MKKKLTNSQGYTLIEVVAVVIILGIILIAAIAGFNKYVEKSKKNYYDKQQKLVTQAGKDYFNDNRGYLPSEIGEQHCVLLKTLIDKKYIDPVVDYNKKTCSKEKSKVCAQKISLTKYEYETVLDCGNSFKTNKVLPPSISYKLENKDFSAGITKVGERNKSYEVLMNVTDTKYNLKSYKYVIYKEGIKKPFFVVGPVSVTDKTNGIDVKIPLNNTGTFHITAYAYNVKGKQVVKKSGKITLTFDKMNCDTAITFTGGTASWTNKSINNTINADDLVKYYYLELKNATNDQTIEKIEYETGKYKIKDKAFSHTIAAKKNQSRRVYYEAIPYDKDGKNHSCVVKSPIYQIDTINPICNISSNNSNWTNQEVIVTVICSDSDSKCTSNTSTIKLNKKQNGNIYKTSVRDNAGNIGECSEVPVKIDTGAPTATITSTNNVDSKQTVTLKCTDDNKDANYEISGYYKPTQPNVNTSFLHGASDISALKGNGLKDKVSDAGKYYLSCKDLAGNVKTVDETFYKTTLVTERSSVTPGVIITKKGNSFNIPQPKDSTGYVFNGWYKDNKYKTPTGNIYTPSSNTSLYAKWTAITYYVKYDANGGSGTMNNSKHTYDIEKELTENEFTRTGYSFNGWNTEKNGSGTSYQNKASVKNLVTENGKTINLYAQWKANKYKIALVPVKNNLLQNYTFTNTTSFTTPKCKTNGTHINEWPTYDLCTKSGANVSLVTDDDSQHGNVVQFNITSSNRSKKHEISQQLPNVLEKGKMYVISMDVKTDSDNLMLFTGLRSFDKNGDKNIISQYISDDEIYDTSFGIRSSGKNRWNKVLWIFKLSDKYEYRDDYEGGYPSNCDQTVEENAEYIKENRDICYLKSNRPEFFIDYENDGTGKMWIDNVALYKIDSDTTYIKGTYDTNITLPEITRNGYKFKGWYNDEFYTKQVSTKDKQLTFNVNNATCYNLDDPQAKDSACYVFAKWEEKTSNSKPISDVVLPSGIGNNSSFSEIVNNTNKVKEIRLYQSQSNDTTMSFRANVTTSATPPIPKDFNYVYMGNAEHPGFNSPGFGGFCQKNGEQDYVMQANKKYYHIIVAGMGNGLYIHPDNSNYTWITDNEGRAKPRTYAYTITPSSNTKACIYFSKNPLKKSEKLRDHMSVYIYSSKVYTEATLPNEYKYLKDV